MTPNELYSREPQRVELLIKPLHNEEGVGMLSSYLSGCYYNHIPEISQYDRFRLTDRAQVRIHKFFDFDGRRIWSLSSMWLDGKPFMIMQNAGREGDDHAQRFITDISAYTELVSLLHSLRIPDDAEVENVIDPEENRNDIDTFYGYSLDDKFERF